MVKCSPEAFAKCQEKCHHCSTADEAYFLEGSDCHKFNQEVLKQPMSNADRIRAMSDEELALNQAILFAKACKYNDPTKCTKEEWNGDYSPCCQCVLEWLKQASEE